MQFGKAFTFVFEDKDWLKKILIAGLIFLIPVIGSITVLGWSLEITRRLINRQEEILPDFSDFGGHIMRGLKAFVITLVYMLPVILISACGQSLPYALIPVMGDSNSDAIGGIIVFFTLCVTCFTIVIGVLIGLVLPAALANFVATDELGAGFRFGEVWGLFKAAPVAYVLVVLGAALAGIIGSLGGILCIIGIVFTYAYALAITGHFYGQAYLEAKSKMAV